MKKYIYLAFLMLPFSLLAQTMVQGKISLKDATNTFAEAGGEYLLGRFYHWYYYR